MIDKNDNTVMRLKKIFDPESVSESEKDIPQTDDFDGVNDDSEQDIETQETDEEVVDETIVDDAGDSVRTKRQKTKTKVKHVTKQKNKNSKKYKILAIIAAVLIVAGGGFVLWDRVLSVKTLDFFELAPTRFVNDGESIFFEMNQDQIVFAENPAVEAVLKTMRYTVNPDGALKEGDAVLVTLTPTEAELKTLKDNKYKLKATAKEIRVEGYSELVSIDFFTRVTVTFKGESGTGVAETTIDSAIKDSNPEVEKVLKQIKVKPIAATDLANGDIVTVSLDLTDAMREALRKENVQLESETKEITVEGLIGAPASIDGIDNFLDLQEKASQKMIADYQKNGIEATNIRMVSACYTATPSNTINATDKESGKNYENGSLMFVFSFDLVTDGKTETFADAYGFTNIMADSNGVITARLRSMVPARDKMSPTAVQEELNQNGFQCQ